MVQEEGSSLVDNFKLSLYRLQEYFILAWKSLKWAPKVFSNREELYREMYLTGAQSFFISMLGGLFCGIIIAIETGHRFEIFGTKTMTGRTVALSMVRELGPVITGLLFAARTGAKNASELGSMKISEQIDAVYAYGLNPIEKFITPRITAAVIMLFPLTMISDISGILGGALVCKLSLSIDYSFFWTSALPNLQLKDLFVGSIKPILFAYSTASISCFYGITTSGGTKGVGRSTINAVVVSMLFILVFDFIITKVVWEVL